MNSNNATTQEQQKVGGVAVVQPPGLAWSEEEQQLAQEYNVEPKTVRLVGHVVERRLEARGGAADVKLTPDMERVVREAASERYEQLVAVVGDLIEKATGRKLSRETDAEPQPRQRGLSDAELTDMVRGVGTIWPEVDEQVETHINHSILASLRNLDYVARQKLMLILHGLHDEQRDDRPESKGYRGSLHGFGTLADDIEKTIADEAFTQRVSDAVFGLSQEDQEKLAEKLEAEQEANAEEKAPEPASAEQPSASDVSKDAKAEPEEPEDEDDFEMTEIDQKVKDWLIAQPFEAKLAHTLLSIGSNADCDLEKFSWSITKQYQQEVASVIEKDAKSLPAETCCVASIASRLIAWQADMMRG